jgi:hypothetical protein
VHRLPVQDLAGLDVGVLSIAFPVRVFVPEDLPAVEVLSARRDR